MADEIRTTMRRESKAARASLPELQDTLGADGYAPTTRSLSSLIRDMVKEGRDAPDLACGELCLEAADRLRQLRRTLLHYGRQCGIPESVMKKACKL